MNPSIIRIKTSDEKEIHSLLYSVKQNDNVVVIVHGACMNFLTGVSSFLPNMTNFNHNYDFLSVNTRAHDMGYIVNSYSEREGWAWQTLQNNQFDLDAVISYLISCGYQEIILCGHSWGGLICLDYMQYHFNKINGLILLSPTISYKLLVEVNFKNNTFDVVEKAKKLISEDLSDEIIMTNKKSPLQFMSAKTIIEFYNNSFEIEQVLERISCKTDIIIGSLEHKKLIEFSKNMSQKNNNIQAHFIKGANHFYQNHELDVVNIIDSILGGKDYE